MPHKTPCRDYFIENLNRDTDDCILWPFNRDTGRHSYGLIKWDRKMNRTHVVACTLTYGPKPNSTYQVAHNCGVDACFNPKHLRWSTAKDNQHDRHAHGTMPTGEKNYNSKLTWDIVSEIRADHKSSERELGRKYGVASTLIGAIRRNQKWKEEFRP